MTDQEIIQDALGRYPQFAYGSVANGLTWDFRLTRVVKMWRNEECYLAGDPCGGTLEGYPRYEPLPAPPLTGELYRLQQQRERQIEIERVHEIARRFFFADEYLPVDPVPLEEESDLERGRH